MIRLRQYWHACLEVYSGRLGEDPLRRFVYRITVELEEGLGVVTVALEYVCDVGKFS